MFSRDKFPFYCQNIRPPDKSVYCKIFSYFSTNFVITQKNHSFRHPKHVIKLKVKEINAVSGAQIILIWTYEISNKFSAKRVTI